MTSHIYELFFELIKVALGNREKLSRIPNAGEWLAIYEESERLAVTGILVAGLERLKNNLNADSNNIANLDQLLLLQWIGISEQVRQENLRLNKCCKQLQQKFGEVGLRSSILKGQGILSYYDDSLRELRQSGDIDIYVDCGMEKALRK